MVVEVLVSRTHATDIQRRVGAHQLCARLDVFSRNDGHGGNNVEPLHRLVDLRSPSNDGLYEPGGILRAEEDGEPPVGDFAAQLEILRPDGRQVNRQGITNGVNGQRERLAGTVGQRQLPELSVVGHSLTTERHAHDVDVLPCPRERLVEPHSVPTLRYLRPGYSQAETETPPGQRVQGRRGHRAVGRRSTGYLKDCCSHVDCRRLCGDPTQHGGGIGAVSLGRPGHRVAQTVGFASHFEIVGVVTGTPVT